MLIQEKQELIRERLYLKDEMDKLHEKLKEIHVKYLKEVSQQNKRLTVAQVCLRKSRESCRTMQKEIKILSAKHKEEISHFKMENSQTHF